MENLVKAICQKEGLESDPIQVLTGGQVNRVYLVGGKFVARIGLREDAYQRLRRETDLLRRLEGKIRVPRIIAFGEQDGFAYQIQQFIPGQKLYALWKNLSLIEQENIVVELTDSLKLLHGMPQSFFGNARQDSKTYESWEAFLTDKFTHTLEEIKRLNLGMVPGIVEMAEEYFHEHKSALNGGVPGLVHGDLHLVNVLANDGKLSAILDFEYSLQAPRDYELWPMEAFCLYPNDYAEENMEVFCAADYANFCLLIKKHYPAIFEIPNLRERLNLYQLDAALGSYLGWRKDNLSTIPAERMAAKEFYMARITNFIFRAGVRMFFV